MKNVNGAGLSGPEGLIISIILRAVDDLELPQFRADALDYLEGEHFCTHLEWLGLHRDIKPIALQPPATRC